MPKLLLPTFASAALTVPLVFAASLAFAQSEAADAPAEAEPAEPGIADDLSLGEAASTEPQLGQTYVSETIGDWNMRCIKTDQEEDPCQMAQLLADGEGNPIAEFSLFRLPDGAQQAKAGATVIVPLETSLQARLAMKVDDEQERFYPFAFCDRVGCYARIGLTDAEVTAFKRGKEATLTIVPFLAQDQKVDIVLSLAGFTAGYDKVSVIDR